MSDPFPATSHFNKANAPGPARLCAGKIGVWSGARVRGEAGVEVWEGYLAYRVWEIPAVPDFSSPRFPDLASLDAMQRVQRVGLEQSQFWSALHSLGTPVAMSLRYQVARPFGAEPRIHLYLIGRCFGKRLEEAEEGCYWLGETVRRNFPKRYALREVASQETALLENLLHLPETNAIVEVVKPERVVSAWHDPALCGFAFYYYPLPFQGFDNDMLNVCHALTRIGEGQSVTIDLTLTPANPLTETERMEVQAWMILCEKWGREQKLTFGGGLHSAPETLAVAPDPHAPDAKKAYQEIAQRYGGTQSKFFLYGVRVLAEDIRTAQTFASALAAQGLSPGNAPQLISLDKSDIRFPRALQSVRGLYVSPSVCNERLWNHPDAPETLRRLHRMADMKELSGFYRLPIPGREGCPGLPLDAGLMQPKERESVGRSGLLIGAFIEGGRVTTEEARLPLDEMSKHALIVGTPGSGKTSLSFSLLTQLWERHRIPFLALEPAKTEYRDLKALPCFQEEMWVFTVGNERVAPFRFNPMEVPDGVAVGEHISALMTCFGGAFHLFDPLPMLLERALRATYEEKGWSEYGLGGEEPGIVAPTLSDLYRHALRLTETSSYRGETLSNIRGALETRLGSLLRGAKGRCFQTERSLPIKSLLERPVVLELESLNDEEKALLMLFLLSAVRAYARTQRRSGSGLRHVLMVEEAHNLIGRGEGATSSDRANPKEVAIRYFTRMLAEMRALGEGILIADQLPTALASEAVKSTNLKVMHRVVAEEDRQVLGGTMALDSGQFQQTATLPVGQSFVFQEGWFRSRLVQESNFKERYGLVSPPDDSELRTRMEAVLATPELQSVYLPYAGCGSVCRLCDPRIREQSERWLERKREEIKSDWERDPAGNRLAIATTAYFHDLGIPKEERARLHCHRVHFTSQVLPSVSQTNSK